MVAEVQREIGTLEQSLREFVRFSFTLPVSSQSGTPATHAREEQQWEKTS
jgi:hypothetical protein